MWGYRYKKDFEYTGLFSTNDKMPGLTFPLPAGEVRKGGSCLASRVSTNADAPTICSDCYALKGRSIFPVVKDSRAKRFEFTKGDDFVYEAVAQLLWEANRAFKKGVRFLPVRVHDSGDFYSIDYIQKWQNIVMMVSVLAARHFPGMTVAFWFPTRMWVAKNYVVELSILQALNKREGVSVSVRPSAIHVGDPCPEVEGLAVGTTVELSRGSCPAVANGLWNKKNISGIYKTKTKTRRPTNCAEVNCFVCWNSTTEVAYGAH